MEQARLSLLRAHSKSASWFNLPVLCRCSRCLDRLTLSRCSGRMFFPQVGRALIRSGEAVYFMDVQAGRLILLPAQSWDMYSGQRILRQLDLSAHTGRGRIAMTYCGAGPGRWCASFSLCHRPIKAVSWGCSTDKRITRWKAISRDK